MRVNGKAVMAGAAAIAVLAAVGYYFYRESQPIEVTLRFHPFVGSEPLVRNEPRYANPGGDGHFAVRDFQFFVSNVRLVGSSDVYAEPDSYHLVRFDGASGTHVIKLRDVPRGQYDRIEFGIGVDADANQSIDPRGDLDPNSRMAWSWETGYKFVLLEGTLVLGDERRPIVYHVGFSENYRPVATGFDADALDSADPRLDFRVDLLRIFTGQSTVDMATLSSVIFDPDDAALLARNYADMISPWISPTTPASD
jgi:hypothetical protein